MQVNYLVVYYPGSELFYGLSAFGMVSHIIELPCGELVGG